MSSSSCWNSLLLAEARSLLLCIVSSWQYLSLLHFGGGWVSVTSEAVISLVLFSFYLFANATFSFHSSPVSLLLYFLFAISFFFLHLFSSVSLYSACFYPSLITLEKEAVSHDPWCIRFVVMILSASLANIELFLLRRSINCRQHSVIICALSQQNKDVQGRYLQAYYHIRNTVPVSSSKVWAQMMQFTLIFSSHSQATVFTWR